MKYRFYNSSCYCCHSNSVKLIKRHNNHNKMSIVSTLILLISIERSHGIIGGKPASPFDWPSLVLVKYYSEHYCGGSFFLPNWVMTAASCVSEKVLGVNMIQGIGVGIFNLNSFEGQIVPYEFMAVQPSFALETQHTINDIAVLRLPSQVPMTDIVHPLPITSNEINPNSSCKTAGWGISSINIYINNVTDPRELFRNDRILYEVDQFVVDLESCKKVDNVPSKLELSSKYHICARSVEKRSGPSFGDIGGPLICNGEQVGISTLTMYNPKVSEFLFVVYTKISTHKAWAEMTVAANPPPLQSTLPRPTRKSTMKDPISRSTRKNESGEVKSVDEPETRSRGENMVVKQYNLIVFTINVFMILFGTFVYE